MEPLTINLGFIGHKAEAIKALFSEFSEEPNENGYFLKFENYTELVYNKGVLAVTNCFENEEHFRSQLFSKLLFNL